MTTRALLAAFLALFAIEAGAAPVKCVDKSGKIRYVDGSEAILVENCQPLRDSTNVIRPQPGASTPSKAARPPAGDGDAGKRDAEIAAAEKRLADAKQKLADQEAVRFGDERNYARVLERLKPYQEAVEDAEKLLQELKQKQR